MPIKAVWHYNAYVIPTSKLLKKYGQLVDPDSGQAYQDLWDGAKRSNNKLRLYGVRAKLLKLDSK
mgnify:FL=1